MVVNIGYSARVFYPPLFGASAGITLFVLSNTPANSMLDLQSKVIFIPRETTIEKTLIVNTPKILLVGDAAEGDIINALASFFDMEKKTPVSER